MTSFPAIFRLSFIFLEYNLVIKLGLGWPVGARWGSLRELFGGCYLEERLLKVQCKVVLYTLCRNHNCMLMRGGP